MGDSRWEAVCLSFLAQPSDYLPHFPSHFPFPSRRFPGLPFLALGSLPLPTPGGEKETER